jgi:MFS family permease
VLPLISGAIAENFGFGTVFIINTILNLGIAATTLMIEKREQTYDLADCLRELKGFKTLILLEGIYGGGVNAAVSVIALFYFARPFELGTYLSITTIFSVIASMLVSRTSDRIRKRKKYIKVSSTVLGLITTIATFANTATAWYIVISIRNFFATLFLPFTTAIVMDNKRHVVKTMVGREMILNIGRIFGVMIVLFCILVLSNIYISLAFLGMLLLFYQAIIESKKDIKVE